MTVLNDLDRFHLVMDTIDRLPQTGDKGIYLKQQLKDKLIEHKQYIDKVRPGHAGNPELAMGQPYVTVRCPEKIQNPGLD